MSILLALEGALGAFSVAAIESERDPGRAASAAGNDALERGLALVAEVMNGRPMSGVTMLAVTTGPVTRRASRSRSMRRSAACRPTTSSIRTKRRCLAPPS
jgi:hypothetical protein